MTQAEVQRIIDSITYKKDWDIHYSWNGSDNYIQLLIPDEKAPKGYWYGRKWRISFHMTPSEIIQTVFLAIQTAEEHETREKFLYKGVAVLGPHWDLNEFAENIIHGYVREDVRDSVQT